MSQHLIQHETHPARFFSDRRAVGSALAAVIFTLMSLAGVALVGDHKHMTSNRDLLKAAANAATIAVLTELSDRSLGDLTTDERNALDATARRYILANIKANVPQDTYQQAKDSLHVNIKPVGRGAVDVEAAANLGNIVFGRWLWPDATSKTQIVSRTERVAGITEIVLAIDITRSMLAGMDGSTSKTRITTVKRAAADLIDTLTADKDVQIAVGLVPWDYLVRLNADTRTRWKQQGWASYPAQRYYPRPYETALKGETQTLPDGNGAGWWGCVDHRSLCTVEVEDVDLWNGCLSDHKTAGTSPPGLSLALPSDEPFTMGFYPARDHRVSSSDWSTAYQCRADKEQDICYDDSLVPQAKRKSIESRLRSPQYGCWENGNEILPLMTDTNKVKDAVGALQALGKNTYSTLGIVWAHRLLAHEWQSAWGDDRTHPVNPAERPDVQKALVLLTDGEDNHVSEAEAHRQHACQAAKDDGITVFTIAAMNTSGLGYSEFREALKTCASKPEYAFVNNATSEALEAAFRDIATQLTRFRRIF